ncbi:hypothetical protein FLK61_37475 [Paenalkalicoccus suaedae]|uniref:Uncharacterized protein n=1 Tax=Paenalkalicoccus suaedae TaxID=2592382 RepID=A0A859FGT8_9BACI|nr:hypothetical protein FLK61_37475 [Paenalkalicoccus suaedae]
MCIALSRLFDKTKNKEEYPAVNGKRNTLTYTYNEDGDVETYMHSRVGQTRFTHIASGKSNSAEGPQEQRMDYMYDESGGI